MKAAAEMLAIVLSGIAAFAVFLSLGWLANAIVDLRHRRKLRDAKATWLRPIGDDVECRDEGAHRNYYRGGKLIHGHEIHRHDAKLRISTMETRTPIIWEMPPPGNRN